MCRLVRAAGYATLPALLAAQPVDPEEILEGVTARVEENLRWLSGYTCELSVETRTRESHPLLPVVGETVLVAGNGSATRNLLNYRAT